MKYLVKEYSASEFVKLKEAWRQLEKGQDMTYYQSYHWNECILKFVPEKKGQYGPLFLLLFENGNPLVICPLWIVYKRINMINKKGVYLLGRQGWSDYLNFVYTDCSLDAFRIILDYIKGKLGIDYCFFEQLKEESLLYNFLKMHIQLNYDVQTTCVQLFIPDSVEDYKKGLSKSSRQNIRTAHNRLKKDGLNITFLHDDILNLSICEKMRSERVVKKNKVAGVRDCLRYLKVKIYKKMSINFPEYLPFYADKQSHFLAAYINGELAAFFNYAYDKQHHQILLMAVGKNEKFVRYSPGILVIFDYVNNLIGKNKIKILDFTRGDESYKYALGGTNHYLHNVKCHL